MVAIGDLMFFRSHTLTVRSSLPETTLSPTVNTADVTVLQDKHARQRYTLVTHESVQAANGGGNELLYGFLFQRS